MMWPTVSVGLVLRNEEQNLTSCLGSLLKAIDAYPGPCKLLIVDNCSTDNTVQLCHTLLTHMKEAYTLHLAQENNLGLARNWCVQQAIGEFILFTDADCRVPVGWLTEMLGSFLNCKKKYPHLVGVGGHLRFPLTYSPFYEALYYAITSPLGHGYSPQVWCPQIPRFVRHISTSNALFLREDILKLGSFSQQKKLVGEDLDLGYRLTAAGKDLLLVPTTPVIHFMSVNLTDWCSKLIRNGTVQSAVGSLRFLTVFVGLSLMAAGTLGFGWIFFHSAFLLYCLTLLAEVTRLKIKSRLPLLTAWRVFTLLLVSHMVYAAGILHLQSVISHFWLKAHQLKITFFNWKSRLVKWSYH